MKIVIGNIGSTSLKTKIIDIDNKNTITPIGKASLDRVLVSGESTFKHTIQSGSQEKEQVVVVGFDAALQLVLDWYIKNGVINNLKDIEAVGFKTVLAGKRGACLLSEKVIDEMKHFAFVAPSHNLPYVETIEVFRKMLGNIPLIGVFEPSFHHKIPKYRRVTGLPFGLEEELGIEQKGYHGAAGRYGVEKVKQMHQQFTSQKEGIFPTPFKVIFNHLGGSCSTHAILDGVSVATSMQFSNQSGHFQSTRIGDLDPFALLYIMKEKNYSIDDMHTILYKESGIRGLSGITSGQMADVINAVKSGDDRAKLTLNAFTDRLRQYIGAYTAVLEGVDAIVFSGGIGENSVDIRSTACRGFEYLGLELDPKKNNLVQDQDERISTDASRIQVYVIRADEEQVIAFFTKEVVMKGRDLKSSEMQFLL